MRQRDSIKSMIIVDKRGLRNNQRIKCTAIYQFIVSKIRCRDQNEQELLLFFVHCIYSIEKIITFVFLLIISIVLD